MQEQSLFESDTSMAQPAAKSPLLSELAPLEGSVVPAATPSNESVPSTALADLRSQSLALSKERMLEALDDYADRRTAFYRWLISQMTQGVHYGVPPGISQPQADPKRWQAKPSLYKSGADFICDLMGLRDEYEADLASWEQLGKPAEVFIRRCRLFSRETGKLIGEGTGARKIGEKKMVDVNPTIKMADKNAKVAAIINSYGLSDLFSQDLENDDRRGPAHEAAEQKPGAPKVAPRDDPQLQPIKQADLERVIAEWKCQTQEPPTPASFAKWAIATVNDEEEWLPGKLSAWRVRELEICRKALGML